MGDGNYIFVSYSHKDKEQVLRFVGELQKYCNVWYDSGIRAGNEWSDELADKLLGCSLFLFFVSPNSLSSDNCKDELALARDYGKPFINLRLTDVAFQGGMQLRYGRYQFFDLFRYGDPRAAIEDLLKSENFGPLLSRQAVLQNLVERTKTMMSRTEEDSGLNEDNAGFFTKLRTVDSTVDFGTYCGAPIQWTILQVSGDRALLVSKDILEARAFGDAGSSYADSELRTWLNTAFAEAAFSDGEKELLLPVAVEGREDLTEKVSLLSRRLAQDLFRSDQDRIKLGTEHAKKNGLMTGRTGSGWWWLSSGSTRAPDCVYRVYGNGRIGFDNDLDNKSIGVVPVITVKIA